MQSTLTQLSTLNIVGAVFIFMNWLMLAPCCIYYTLLFVRKSNLSIYRHILQLRRPACLQFNLAIILYFLLFEQTLTMLHVFEIVPEIPTIIPLALSLPTFCLVLYSGIIRAWLLFYDQCKKPHSFSYHYYYHIHPIDPSQRSPHSHLHRKHNKHNYDKYDYNQSRPSSHRTVKVSHSNSSGYHLAVGDESTQFEQQEMNDILSFFDPKFTAGNICCLYSIVFVLYFLSIFLLLIFGGLAINEEDTHSPETFAALSSISTTTNNNNNNNDSSLISLPSSLSSTTKGPNMQMMDDSFSSTEYRSLVHLAMIQLLVMGCPVLISCVLMLIVQHYQTRREDNEDDIKFQNEMKKKKRSKSPNLSELHRQTKVKETFDALKNTVPVPLHVIQRLDREVIYILAFIIICCLFRIILSISSNLITIHCFSENDTSALYNLWIIDDHTSPLVDVVYTAFGQLSVFSLHLLQTWRTLSILRESEWSISSGVVNQKKKKKNKKEHIASKSKSTTKSNTRSKSLRSPSTESKRGPRSMSDSGELVRYKNIENMDTDESSDDDDDDGDLNLNDIAVDNVHLNLQRGMHLKAIKGWISPSNPSHATTSPLSSEITSPLQLVPNHTATTKSDEDGHGHGPLQVAGLTQCSAEIQKCQSVQSNQIMTKSKTDRARTSWRTLLFRNESADHREKQRMRSNGMNGCTPNDVNGENVKDRSAPFFKSHTYHGVSVPALIARSHRFKQIFGKSKSANIDSIDHDHDGDRHGNGDNDGDHDMMSPLKIGLRPLLAVKEGYDLFMKHLQSEFAAENLSFLTEVAQFKQRFVSELMHDLQWSYHAQMPRANRIKSPDLGPSANSCTLNNLNLTNDDWLYAAPRRISASHSQRDDDDFRAFFERKYPSHWINCYRHCIRYGWYLSFHGGVPLSDIMAEDHWRSFLFKAHRIFTKYVQNGADSEINISYHCRAALSRYFETKMERHPSSSRILDADSNSNGNLMEKGGRGRNGSMENERSSRHQQLATQHSMDDLSRFSHRRGSTTVNVVDDDFGGIKKSRSFHNVYDATNDDRYFSSDAESDGDGGNDGDHEIDGVHDDGDHDQPPVPGNGTSDGVNVVDERKQHSVQCQTVPELTRILTALDEKSFLLQIFDGAATEIVSVLRRDSLNRFYDTRSYSQFVRNYIPDERRWNKEKKEREQHQDAIHGVHGERDLNAVFWFFCQCRESGKCRGALSSSSSLSSSGGNKKSAGSAESKNDDLNRSDALNADHQCQCNEDFVNRETVEMKQKRLKRGKRRGHVRSRTSPMVSRMNKVISTESNDDGQQLEPELDVIRKFIYHRSCRSRTGRSHKLSGDESDELKSPRVSGRRPRSGSRRSILSEMAGDDDDDDDGREQLQIGKWKKSETASSRRRYREDLDATLSPSSQVIMGRPHDDEVPIVRVINVDIHRNGSSVGSDGTSFPRKTSGYTLVDPPGSLD